MITDDCIEWDRNRDEFGYGMVWGTDGFVGRIHRLAWIEVNGTISEDLCVLHRCDNPACFNVDHLFLGTRADNVADMMAKGRHGGNGGHGGAAFGESNANAKLAATDIPVIRSMHAQGHGVRAIGRAYGVAHTTILRILKGDGWK
jgi:hypothetical protein